MEITCLGIKFVFKKTDKNTTLHLYPLTGYLFQVHRRFTCTRNEHVQIFIGSLFF